ncbi:lytic transglycosylase domain-containing protein [Erythrobacter sp.]|jgi:soluble lytic murein transglycosylase-like protein|uniref:lytic transglycosylase domain-containing protein n=1 Tax=Erythrobacter sp. TaxID=1042 RepID=UPI002EA83887|nr:lytic transglycosylase domain-containing protein [Erythrobacter sp.]
MIVAMVVARASRWSLAAAFVLSGVAAEADVMEVDGDGARWVAGGFSASGDVPVAGEDLSAEYAALPGADEAVVLPDGAKPDSIPHSVIADPAAHSAAIPAAYAEKVHELARRFDLSPALLEAVVWQESRWRADAVSNAGARGLAQLMPGTARYLGVDPEDPHANLEGGARYLREQLDRFDGDLEKALAAYNAGPGRVIRAGGIPNIRETKGYVAAIMGRLASHSRPAAE